MVLEDANADSSSFQSDSQPSSDVDTFSDSRPATDFKYDIDTTRFAKPIPILGPLVGISARYQMQAIASIVDSVNKQILPEAGRTMTREECQAFSEHYSTVMSSTSYGRALGVLVGVRQCYSGWATFRLPMWQPDLTSFNPDRIGPLRGAVSRAFLHTIRGTSYYGLGFFLGGYIGSNFGLASAFVNSRADPRLKDLWEIANGRLAKEAEKRRARANSRTAQPGAHEGERDVGSEMSSRSVNSPVPRAWPSPTSKPSQNRYDDDMSPTSGAFFDTYTSNGSKSDGGWSEENTARENDRVSRGFAASSRANENPSQSRGQTRRESVESASSSAPSQSYSWWPSSRSDTPSPPTPSSSSSPSESSWDHIRRASAGGSQVDSSSPRGDAAQQQQSASASPYDSFSFSSTDEDRSLAQAEAQKDFDARVERERQGKDF